MPTSLVSYELLLCLARGGASVANSGAMQTDRRIDDFTEDGVQHNSFLSEGREPSKSLIRHGVELFCLICPRFGQKHGKLHFFASKCAIYHYLRRALLPADSPVPRKVQPIPPMRPTRAATPGCRDQQDI